MHADYTVLYNYSGVQLQKYNVLLPVGLPDLGDGHGEEERELLQMWRGQ